MNRGTPTTAPANPPTSVEDEIDALDAIVAQFKTLDKDAQVRVVRYLVSRFGVYLPSSE